MPLTPGEITTQTETEPATESTRPALGDSGIRSMQGQLVELPPETIHVPAEKEIRFDEMGPKAKYEKNGYTFETDELGRPTAVGGHLKLETGPRSQQQREVGHQGKETDEGGHLIATRFDGPPDGFNLVPQDVNLNRGAWKAMENDWAEALEEDQPVEVAITPVYLGETKRPDGFDVIYQIGQDLYTKTFYNESAKEGNQ